MVYEIPHYIGGKTVAQKSTKTHSVTNPAFGEAIGIVHLADSAL